MRVNRVTWGSKPLLHYFKAHSYSTNYSRFSQNQYPVVPRADPRAVSLGYAVTRGENHRNLDTLRCVPYRSDVKKWEYSMGD